MYLYISCVHIVYAVRLVAQTFQWFKNADMSQVSILLISLTCARYTQFTLGHALGTVPYRWDQQNRDGEDYLHANLVQVLAN